jgi:general secretion pathway protein K
MKTTGRQRGTVVIIAMLIVALAAAAASYAVQRQDLSVRQLEVARDYEQARWVLVGGAHWARAILAEDARSGSIDHAAELWTTGLAPTSVEHGTLEGAIRDAQGLFNLANLRRDGKPSEPDIAAFKRLLAAMGLRAQLGDAIAAAQPMRELSELQSVPGCDAATLRRLREVVTILPQRTAVNVNTARAEVLAAAIEGLGLAEALVLAQGLKASPARALAELRPRLPRPDLPLDDEALAVRSRFFLVDGRARFGTADVRMQALLQREGASLPVIVWQRAS